MAIPNGAIHRKLLLIEQVVMELRTLVPVTVADLENDWRIRRAVERGLQVAVEAMIDVCQRLISLRGLTVPGTGAESVGLCVELGALSPVEPYRRMVQFRNYIVHHDEMVDPAVLAEIVNRRLDDFENFCREIQVYDLEGNR